MNDTTVETQCPRCKTGTVKILEMYIDCGVTFLCAKCTGFHRRPVEHVEVEDTGKHKSLSPEKKCPKCGDVFLRSVFGFDKNGATKTYCPACRKEREQADGLVAKAKRRQARIDRELVGAG